jgi:hypothetical protein
LREQRQLRLLFYIVQALAKSAMKKLVIDTQWRGEMLDLYLPSWTVLFVV